MAIRSEVERALSERLGEDAALEVIRVLSRERPADVAALLGWRCGVGFVQTEAADSNRSFTVHRAPSRYGLLDRVVVVVDEPTVVAS